MKIALLISGGVDSSVSLRLLKDAGHDVTAFYLKIWLEDEMSFLGECPWEEDLSFIRAVCREVKVLLEVVPFQKEYRDRIIRYALDEVRAGRTPNPDVLCNTRVKFGAFFEYLTSRSDGASFEKIASGHYAQTREVNGRTLLALSPDETKDQTYFLSQLSREQLSRALFPIGHLRKEEVRALAKKFNLPNATRKDSQGLCFLGKIRFDEFVKFHLGTREGAIVDAKTGKEIGRHEGFWYYTIGQRKGIKLSGGPWYVVGKDVKKNEVFVSNAYRSAQSMRDSFVVRDMHWMVPDAPPFLQSAAPLQVKIRHGAQLFECAIEQLADGRSLVRLTDASDAGIAPGQFAAFYAGEYCLGGGVIDE